MYFKTDNAIFFLGGGLDILLFFRMPFLGVGEGMVGLGSGVLTITCHFIKHPTLKTVLVPPRTLAACSTPASPSVQNTLGRLSLGWGDLLLLLLLLLLLIISLLLVFLLLLLKLNSSSWGHGDSEQEQHHWFWDNEDVCPTELLAQEWGKLKQTH